MSQNDDYKLPTVEEFKKGERWAEMYLSDAVRASAEKTRRTGGYGYYVAQLAKAMKEDHGALKALEGAVAKFYAGMKSDAGRSSVDIERQDVKFEHITKGVLSAGLPLSNMMDPDQAWRNAQRIGGVGTLVNAFRYSPKHLKNVLHADEVTEWAARLVEDQAAFIRCSHRDDERAYGQNQQRRNIGQPELLSFGSVILHTESTTPDGDWKPLTAAFERGVEEGRQRHIDRFGKADGEQSVAADLETVATGVLKVDDYYPAPRIADAIRGRRIDA